MSPSYSKHFRRRASTHEVRIFLSQTETVAGMQPAIAMAGKLGPVRTGGRPQSHFGFWLLETLVLLLFCCSLRVACAQNHTVPTQFVLRDFSASTISCIGNSTATSSDDAIRLTAPDTSNGTSQISGGCFYSKSIQFSSDFSFSTMFAFNTSTLLNNDQGAYLSFFMSGACDSAAAAATSQCLGLLGQDFYAQRLGFSGILTLNQSVLVELNLRYGVAAAPRQYVTVIVSDNEGGRSGGSSAGPLPAKGQLDRTYVWIEYDNQTQNIEVSVSLEPKKPCDPSTDIGPVALSEAINSHSQSVMGFFVSFAPETNALTNVYDWSFNASGPAQDIFEGKVKKCSTAAAKRQLILEIVVPVLSGALVLLVGFVVLLYLRANRQSKENASLIRDKERLVADLKLLDFGARELTYKQLKDATDGFTREIGKGGFGTVYKGTLPGIGTVAVKEIKRTKDNTEDAKQLVAEVQVIGRMRHVNIVPIHGWCYDQGVMLLVYKFVDNGDLDSHIFPRTSLGAEWLPLAWNKRMKALRGVAAALVFLHEEFESEEEVLHRDIKPTNVMLDSRFNARLGDFGLARLSKRTDSGHHHTEGIAGTPGYVAPDYIYGATAATDVYSFGVLVLVVATGRRPLDRPTPGQPAGLVSWVRALYDQGKVEEAGDINVRDGSRWGPQEMEEMQRVLKVGLSCCLYEPSDRPNMTEALNALQGSSRILSAPLPPQFPAPAKYPSLEALNKSFISTGSDSDSSPLLTRPSLSSHRRPTVSFETSVDYIYEGR